MDRSEMLARTKQFAIRIVKLVGALPKDRVGDVIGKQLLRSGTSIGANYREALRASSRKQYLSKLEIAEREADETLYWLELLVEANVMQPTRLTELLEEAQQLVAILTASGKTTRQNINQLRQ
jgi:four helix bundle protein